MEKHRAFKDLLLVAAGALVCLVLRGTPQRADAKSPSASGTPPFASALKQRQDMIRRLETLSRQVAEQTRFLKSGELKVLIELRDERKKR